MTDISTANDLFFLPTGMDRNVVEKQVSDALEFADDGELFLEYRQSEGFSFDDGRLKSASFDTTQRNSASRLSEMHQRPFRLFRPGKTAPWHFLLRVQTSRFIGTTIR